MDSVSLPVYKISFILLIISNAVCDDSSEVQSLLAFKRSITGDPLSRLSNWYSGSANPCNWTGIICSSGHEGGHVVEIQLGDSSLDGTISEYIGNLSRLQILNLSQNQLSGAIPASLGRLSSLEYLHLSGNLLHGSIPPTLGNCSKLSYLNLCWNSLQGTIPPTLLLNCESLEELYLHANNMSGTIPPSLGNCHKLRYLNLSGNSLHGKIPSTLLNCTALEELYLRDNQYISGRIPGEIGLILAKLRVLDVASNNLTGRIPASLCNATSLKIVILSANELTGVIPYCLGELPRLEYLRAMDNHLVSGTTSPDEAIPILQSLSNNSILKELVLDENNLSGMLPLLFHRGLNPKLNTLRLASNAISGSIPQSLADLSILTELNLSTNLLTGTIPAALGSLNSLKILDLGHNRLHGEIPYFSGTNLQSLHLSHNLLIGKIPVEFRNSSSLSQVDLSHNSLVGNITPKLIPHNLMSLNLSFNNLTGVLPGFISTNMQILDLRSNELTGAVPRWVLSVPQLNLSYNQFEGSINCSLDKNIFLGNSKIQRNCLQKAAYPSSAHPIKKRVPHACIFGIVALVIMIFVAVIILLVKKFKDQAPENVLNQDASFIPVRERELIKATNNFHQSNFLGRGRYGVVYKGILANGLSVGIKLFSTVEAAEEGRVHESFKRECRTLGQIRHRNLVKMITVCCSKKFNALILEFMPNGTLDDLLHRPISDGRLMPLSLKTRIHLLKEVASALSYLHHDCNPSIIHCDVKPQNVLLDEDMSAKVADFDTACILGRSDMTTAIRLQGSIGYIAPEYGGGAQVRISGDVYSFGVLILEVLTRIRPTDSILAGDFTLSKWIATALVKGRTYCKEVMIKNRNGQRELEILCDEEFSILEGLLKLGLWCTSEWPAQRPTMREVEKLIEDSIVENFSGFKSNVDEILRIITCIQARHVFSEPTASSTIF